MGEGVGYSLNFCGDGDIKCAKVGEVLRGARMLVSCHLCCCLFLVLFLIRHGW